MEKLYADYKTINGVKRSASELSDSHSIVNTKDVAIQALVHESKEGSDSDSSKESYQKGKDKDGSPYCEATSI